MHGKLLYHVLAFQKPHLQKYSVHQRLLKEKLEGLDFSFLLLTQVETQYLLRIDTNRIFIYCYLVAGRTWMPTMMMTMLKMRGSIITLLPPLAGMTPETTKSRLPTCARTATPRTIIRAPMSTVGIASCRPPCLCERTRRRRACLCVNMCACICV